MHTVKRGDTKTLRWNLGRDLTGVTATRVIIKHKDATAAAIDRAGTIDNPVTAGIVSLVLQVADYAAGKLEPNRIYLVEIETQPGPLTHPDGATGYEHLHVLADLG